MYVCECVLWSCVCLSAYTCVCISMSPVNVDTHEQAGVRRGEEVW